MKIRDLAQTSLSRRSCAFSMRHLAYNSVRDFAYRHMRRSALTRWLRFRLQYIRFDQRMPFSDGLLFQKSAGQLLELIQNEGTRGERCINFTYLL